MKIEKIKDLPPAEVRKLIREGKYQNPTAGLCPGYVQANLVILPFEWAYDFLLFCVRNPKSCPLIEVTDPGDPTPLFSAPQADLRTDLPKYRIWKNGKVIETTTDIKSLWRKDFVAFLLGCSFSFERALISAGIPVRHIEEGKNVSMYKTILDTTPAGRLKGKLVVTMRPIPGYLVPKAVSITERFRYAHGSPVHVGDPKILGIEDLSKPDFGDAVTIKPTEVPVFWACGVTAQIAIANSGVPFAITHAPGHMFITDIKEEELIIT